MKVALSCFEYELPEKLFFLFVHLLSCLCLVLFLSCFMTVKFGSA